MLKRTHSEAGETLLEIVIALIVIGLVIGGYFAAYATVTTGSKSQRDLATADSLLRASAETTKAAVSHDCDTGSTYTPAPVTMPPGFTLSTASNPSGRNCPDPDSLQQVTFTITMPNGKPKQLAIEVRSP